MKKNYFYIFKRILLVILLSLFFSSTSFADGILSVPERIQEHSQWCWDASSKANLDYYGKVVSQCTIANWALGYSNCCGNTTFNWNHPCNVPNSMTAIRNVHAHWGVNGNIRGYALTQGTVTSEINAGRPFIMAWYWTGGGGHALSGRGIIGNNVYYMDPWPGNGYTISTYSFVLNGTGHVWGQTLQLTTTLGARDEIIGTWGNGIWYRNVAAGTWKKMYSYVPSGPIAAGDVTGDGRADVISCWRSGLWYQNGSTLGWVKVYSYAPSKVASGDVTGDGRDEIIGTWSTGIWYRNVAAGTWKQMYPWVPPGPIAAGDVTGNGRAEAISCWNSGLWYQNGSTLGWTKVYSYAPSKVASGDVTGDGRNEIIGTWSSGIWYRNVAAGTWKQMYPWVPSGPIAAGDVTGDGKADVVSCWGSVGLWYQNGATLGWTKEYIYAPSKVACGNVTNALSAAVGADMGGEETPGPAGAADNGGN